MYTSIVSDPHVIGKARQLVASGSVRPTVDPYRWIVQSQSDPDTTYTVDTRRNGASCTCPAKKPCKHILAVKLFQTISRHIEAWLNSRPDFDVAKLLDQLNRRNPLESAREKNNCFIAVAHAKLQWQRQSQPQPTNLNLQNAATAFFIRYWWPGTNPQAALDPISMEWDKARDVQVRGAKDPGFRPSTQTLEQILAYIEDQGLQPGTPQSEQQRRGDGSAREWLFTIPVLKPRSEQ